MWWRNEASEPRDAPPWDEAWNEDEATFREYEQLERLGEISDAERAELRRLAEGRVHTG